MGLLIVFLGWPWLWLDPVKRLSMFLVSSAQRPPIHVFYWGQVWNDADVPWHYPLAMFSVTMPAGLLFLGLLGIVGRLPKVMGDLAPQRYSGETTTPNGKAGYELMILIQLLFWLGLFAWPGTPVYDGERLFLLLYPLWAAPVIWGVRFLHRGCEQSLEVGSLAGGSRTRTYPPIPGNGNDRVHGWSIFSY